MSWEISEIQYLLTNVNEKDYLIAKHLNKSLADVRKKRQRMGIKKKSGRDRKNEENPNRLVQPIPSV